MTKKYFFAALRLSLVSQNTAEAQYLSQALFGILMLLPQTDAFILLKNRLQCIPHSVKNASYVEHIVKDLNGLFCLFVIVFFIR